ncbi:hypothetical protein EON63_13945 [archaeon]|nr:MAG: hypothetical protein EON63_13945 [archaeon]
MLPAPYVLLTTRSMGSSLTGRRARSLHASMGLSLGLDSLHSTLEHIKLIVYLPFAQLVLVEVITMTTKRSKWDSDSDEDLKVAPKTKELKESKKNKADKTSSSSYTILNEETSGKRKRALSPPLLATLQTSTSQSHTTGIPQSSHNPYTSNTESGQTAPTDPPNDLKVDRYIGPCRSVENYVPLNYIDQGTYGTVFRALCQENKRVYALKQIKLTENSKRNGFPITAFREINVLLDLTHDCIIGVKEMVVGEECVWVGLGYGYGYGKWV